MEEMNQAPSTEKKVPWYFKSGSLVIAFLCVGPLMLPLVWVHPRMTSTRKMVWTVVIVIATYFLVVATMDSLKKVMETYQQMKATMP